MIGLLATPYAIIVGLVVAALMIAGAAIVVPRTWPSGFRRLVLGAVVAHIIGGQLRLLVMVLYYGSGDFLRYYSVGLEWAMALREAEALDVFWAGQLWGTQFIERLSALVLVVIGPSIFAEFAVFSTMATAGLVLICVATLRGFKLTGTPARRVTTLVLFWPSLLFWPSSVGKEAVILLAVGLFVWGWVGDGRRPQWFGLGAGLLLAFLVRPHIALMMAVAVGVADLFATFRLSAGRVLQAGVLLVVAIVVARSALSQLGVEEGQGLQEFITDRAARTAQGGSKIEVYSGVAVVPMSFVNVLLRPFPWEVSNPLVLLSAAEVLVFWGLLLQRRDRFALLLKVWRQSRLLRLLLPLVVVLIFFYGGFVSNLGILARQRVVILPFMFVFVEALGSIARAPPSSRRVVSREQRPAEAR